jgi:hypothetical protein
VTELEEGCLGKGKKVVRLRFVLARDLLFPSKMRNLVMSTMARTLGYVSVREGESEWEGTL